MNKQKIIICMLIDAWFPFVGGGQVHVQNLIKHLEKTYPIKVYLFHSPHHNIIIRAFWCLWVIPQVLSANRQMPFALIHAHAFASSFPGKIISRLLNIPIIYTVHGSHLIDLQAKGLKPYLERWLLTKITYSAQISVTKSFLNLANVNKPVSIPNGVDITAFDQVTTKKLPDFTLLYVGRDHPTKGLEILRQAFTAAWHQYPYMKLELVTSGAITGEKLIKTYKQAHGFVLPSLVEGQPLVLLEAWAAKLPVIATKTPGVAEIASDGINALLIRPGNVDELTHAIVKLYLMKPNQRDQLGQRGYTKARREFTWKHVAQKTFVLYTKLIPPRPH